jgi:hypothetical protein
MRKRADDLDAKGSWLLTAEIALLTLMSAGLTQVVAKDALLSHIHLWWIVVLSFSMAALLILAAAIMTLMVVLRPMASDYVHADGLLDLTRPSSLRASPLEKAGAIAATHVDIAESVKRIGNIKAKWIGRATLLVIAASAAIPLVGGLYALATWIERGNT